MWQEFSRELEAVDGGQLLMTLERPHHESLGVRMAVQGATVQFQKARYQLELELTDIEEVY